MKIRFHAITLLLLMLCMSATPLFALNNDPTSPLLHQNPDLFLPQPAAPDGDSIHCAVESWDRFSTAFMNFITSTRPSRPFFRYHRNQTEPVINIEARLLTGFDSWSIEDAATQLWWYGMNFTGKAGAHLSLWGRWWSGHYVGDLDYADSEFVHDWRDRDGDVMYHDGFEGALHWNSPWLEVELGRGRFNTGTSITGSVILNDRGLPYSYLGLDVPLGSFRLESLHASLLPDSLDEETGLPAGKYLALHWLVYQPSERFRVFIGESVVYGNRGIDLAYLLPGGMMRILEHRLGDRDNVLLFYGMDAGFGSGWSCHVNLLFDEMRKSEIFSNWWGNKYAIQGSIMKSWKNGTTLGFETTAVRPWTYTHYTLAGTYGHDTRPLGHPDGANLIDLAMEINLPLTSTLRLDARAGYFQQGSVGNSHQIDYTLVGDLDTATADWLEGAVTTLWRIRSELVWHPLYHHQIHCRFQTDINPDNDDRSDWQLNIGYRAFY